MPRSVDRDEVERLVREEGGQVVEVLAGHALDRDVPTCGPVDRVGDIARAGTAGKWRALVVNEHGVVTVRAAEEAPALARWSTLGSTRSRSPARTGCSWAFRRR